MSRNEGERVEVDKNTEEFKRGQLIVQSLLKGTKRGRLDESQNNRWVALVVDLVIAVVAVWRTPHFSGKQSGLPFLVVVMLVTVLKVVNPVEWFG